MKPNDFNNLVTDIYDTICHPGEWVKLIEAAETWEKGSEPTVANSPENQQEIEILINHLDRAVQAGAYTHQLEDKNRVFSEMAQKMPWPMLMMDKQSNVVESNSAADQILTNEFPVLLSKFGQLQFADQELGAQLNQSLSLKLGRQPQILCSERDRIILLCLPVKRNSADVRVANVSAIVWVLASHQVIPAPQTLEQIFHITPAESKVLHLLCKTGKLKQSAEILSISIHTARSQIKSIMGKLNASSQAELVSHAMSHPLLVGAQMSSLGETSSDQGEERFITLKDGRILSWYEFGCADGEPIVVLEGLGASFPYHPIHQQWYDDQGLRIIVPVRAGYGISTAREDAAFKAFAGDIKALCEHLKLRRPKVAAYCLGAGYGLSTAAQESDLFSEMALLAPVVPISLMHIEKMDRMHRMLHGFAAKANVLFTSIAQLAIRGITRDPRRFFNFYAGIIKTRDSEVMLDQQVQKQMVEMMSTRWFQGAQVVIEEYQALQNPWQIELADIQIPVTIWHGEDDHIFTPASVTEMSQRISNLKQLKIIPGQGRYLVVDLWRQFILNLTDAEEVTINTSLVNA